MIFGILTFGPDRYADGTTVLDGESHDLVATTAAAAPKGVEQPRIKASASRTTGRC